MGNLRLSDIYNNLKVGVLGTKTSEIDRQIDKSLKSIATHSSKIDRNSYMQTVNDLISSLSVDTSTTDIMKEIQQLGGIEHYDQDRINRYKEYEAVTARISYCQRALRVLTDNIIAPDDITKRTLQIISEVDDNIKEDDVETAIARLKVIKADTGIENFTEKIVSSTLKGGDYFIEILHSVKGSNLDTILCEGNTSEDDEEQDKGPIDLIEIGINHTIDANKELNQEELHIKRSGNIILEGPFGGSANWGAALGSPRSYGMTNSSGYSKTQVPFTPHGKSVADKKSNSKMDDENDKDKFKDKFSQAKYTKDTKAKLRDVFLVMHDPKYVVRLETERFRTNLGFLVFPKVDMVQYNAVYNSMPADKIDEICKKLIEILDKKVDKAIADNIVQNKDIHNVVKNYLTSIKEDEDLRVRYVPPDKMVHFRLNTDRFHPYGESIFEPVMFDCKLLMALKTATTIKRITSATDKRIISVETGIPRETKNAIEHAKETIRKRKFSIDSFGSLDSIPSHIPTFEDIYLPMKDGKKFIEIDHGQFGSDPNQDIEGLKFIRDNIVANLMVPAPFLGLEENTSNRALLTVENIIFARTIIAYQKEFSVFLKEVFEKVYKIVWPEDTDSLDTIKVTFPPPKATAYEHQMEYVEHIQRLTDALTAMDIPKDWIKKKYLPDFPWDEIEQEAAKEKIANELKGSATDDAGGGGYSGY